MFGNNKSLRTKYKKDIGTALDELKTAINVLKKATKQHQSQFSAYYKKRASYQAALNKIGVERYQKICDDETVQPTEVETKILALLGPLGDELRDLADGDLGVDIADSISSLAPLEKAVKAKEQKVETARMTLQLYLMKKAEFKSKEDKDEYNEWKKALREMEFQK